MPDLVPTRPLVKRPSRWGRWFRAIEFAVQLTAAVLYVLYAIRYYQITTRLNEALAEMDRTDPGWRLQDIEAARAVVPDDENSALRVTGAGDMLPWSGPNRWIEEDFETQLESLPPDQRMSRDQFDHLHQRLEAVRPALEIARQISALSKGRFPIRYNWADPYATSLAGEQKAARVCQLLYLDAMAAVQVGDKREALTAWRAGLNVGRSIGDEPLGISQMIRAAAVMISCKTLARIMAQCELDPGDLQAVQAVLQEEDLHPYWPISFRGQRAFICAELDAIESGTVTQSQAAGGGPPTWKDRLFDFAFRDGIRVYHAHFLVSLEHFQNSPEYAGPHQGPILDQVDRQLGGAGLAPDGLTLPMLRRLSGSATRCHATLRTCAAALAAERYRCKHGDWPPSLDILVPDFIAAVPDDPFTGEPLIYRRLADGVVIYTVGPDGKDDGGNVDVPNVSEPGTDLGIRLWNVASRRQPPLPPAPPR